MAKSTTRIIKDFNPAAVEEIRRRLMGMGKSPTVNVGFPASAGQHDEAEMNVASLAAVHEFGAGNVPERSFLRVAIRNNREKYVLLNRQNLALIVRGQMGIDQALGQLGELAKSDVQMEITEGDFAPLSAATINRKGSSKPLIDSGQMRQSVAWEYGND